MGMSFLHAQHQSAQALVHTDCLTRSTPVCTACLAPVRDLPCAQTPCTPTTWVYDLPETSVHKLLRAQPPCTPSTTVHELSYTQAALHAQHQSAQPPWHQHARPLLHCFLACPILACLASHVHNPFCTPSTSAHSLPAHPIPACLASHVCKLLAHSPPAGTTSRAQASCTLSTSMLSLPHAQTPCTPSTNAQGLPRAQVSLHTQHQCAQTFYTPGANAYDLPRALTSCTLSTSVQNLPRAQASCTLSINIMMMGGGSPQIGTPPPQC